MRKNLDDQAVLRRMQELRNSGQETVRAGEIARFFSVDSVRALGAMERVKHRLQEAA